MNGFNTPLQQGTYQNNNGNIQQQQPAGQFQPMNQMQNPQQVATPVQPMAMPMAQPQQQPPSESDVGTVMEIADVGMGTNKEGKPWRRHKLKVQGDTTRLHTYSMFTGPDKKMTHAPQLGERIRFGFVKQPNPLNPDAPYRNLIWYEQSTTQDVQQQAPVQQQQILQQQAQTMIPQTFVQDYNNALQNTGKIADKNHFIGTFYANFVNDQTVQKLIEIYKQNYGGM